MNFLSNSGQRRIDRAECAVAAAQDNLQATLRAEQEGVDYLKATMPTIADEPFGYEHFKLLAEIGGIDHRYIYEVFGQILTPLREWHTRNAFEDLSQENITATYLKEYQDKM